MAGTGTRSQHRAVTELPASKGLGGLVIPVGLGRGHPQLSGVLDPQHDIFTTKTPRWWFPQQEATCQHPPSEGGGRQGAKRGCGGTGAPLGALAGIMGARAAGAAAPQESASGRLFLPGPSAGIGKETGSCCWGRD